MSVSKQENFKKITLNYDSLDEKDLLTIKSLNDAFGQDEMRLESKGNQVTVLLREIDIDKLKGLGDSLNGFTNRQIVQDVVAAIEQIKSYGINGSKRNYVDYNKERKVKNRKNKETKRTQYYYAQNNTFSKTNNELPEKYKDKIITDDSEAVLKNIPDNCIDLVFTSPPYNFGLDYAENQDAHYWEDYFEKLFRVFGECVRVLKYGGRIKSTFSPCSPTTFPATR